MIQFSIMKITNIFLFGDSITYGARDTENGGWATQLRVYFDKKTGQGLEVKYYCYNLGISGETTDGLLSRFKAEATARIEPEEENVIVFAYGANDSAYLPKEKRFNVTLEKFQSNLEEMVVQAKTFSSKMVFLNITPVIDSLTKSREYRSRLNEYLAKYNDVIQKTVDKHKLALIDVNSVFVKIGTERLFSSDGLHPNAEGHKVILDTVTSSLEKIL
jgi:lysophospholipase L1-like esterase